MPKQFLAYLLSFSMVNMLAYPPHARAADTSAGNDAKNYGVKNMTAMVGRPIEFTTSTGEKFAGIEYVGANGQKLPVSWDPSVSFKQFGTSYRPRNDRQVLEDMGASTSQNRAEIYALATKYKGTPAQQQAAMTKQAAIAKAEEKAETIEKKAERKRMIALREFQGLLVTSMQMIDQSIQTTSTPVVGRLPESPAPKALQDALANKPQGTKDKGASLEKKKSASVEHIKFVKNYRQLKKRKASLDAEALAAEKERLKAKSKDGQAQKAELEAKQAQLELNAKQAAERKLRLASRGVNLENWVVPKPSVHGLSEWTARIHKEAYNRLITNVRVAIVRYEKQNGGKAEGELLDGIEQLLDIAIAKVNAEKRNEVKAFLESFRETLNSRGMLTILQAQLDKSKKTGTGELFLMQELHNSLMRFQLDHKAYGTVMKESTLRFPKDTILFFIAIGAVMASQLYFDYGSNPRSMQTHIESLTDPLANLAFYSFMLANGVSGHWLQKHWATGRPSKAAREKAFRLIPYLSMTAGSFASNVTTDLGQLFKTCVGGLYERRNAKTPLPPADPYTLSACDESLRTWTVEGKVNQYIPAMMSMLLSNKVAAVLEHDMLRPAIAKSRAVISEYAHNPSVMKSKNLIDLRDMSKSKGFLLGSSIDVDTKLAKAATGFAIAGTETTSGALLASGANLFKGTLLFLGSSIGMVSCGPGCWTVSGMRLLYTVAQFTAFTFLDHLIAPFVMITWSNLWSPAMFHFLNRKIERSIYFAGANGFMDNETPSGGDVEHLPELILGWRDWHLGWRSSQNADFEASFMAWGESLKNITTQYFTSRSYTVTFLDLYMNMLESQEKINSGTLSPHDAANQPMIIIKKYPLYGVAHPSVSLLEDTTDKYELDEATKKAWDNHLGSPAGLQKNQLEVVNKLSAKFNSELDANIHEGYARAKNIYTDLMGDLIATDVMQVSRGLTKLRRAVIGSERLTNPELARKLHEFYNSLGEPSPILTPGMGYPYVFAKNSDHKSGVLSYNIPYTTSGYSFEKSTDYLSYQMLCGDEKPSIIQTIGFDANFLPASIVSLKKDELFSICNAPNAPADASNQWVRNYTKKFRLKDGREVDGIMQFILNNLQPQFDGKYGKNFDSSKHKTGEVSFAGDWWDETTLAPMEEFYKMRAKDWEPIYRKLAVRLTAPDNRRWTIHATADLLKQFIMNPLQFKSPFDIKVDKYDASFGDALKSTIRTFKMSEAVSQNLVDSLRQEASLYNSVLRGLAKYHTREFADIDEDDANLERDAQEREDLPKAVEHFIKLVDKNITHISFLQFDINGKLINKPTRSDMREYRKEMDEMLVLLKAEMPKLMLNDYQKELFQNTMIAYSSTLNDMQKYRMAAFMTEYDRAEDLVDREEELKAKKDMVDKMNAVKGQTKKAGSNPRGG